MRDSQLQVGPRDIPHALMTAFEHISHTNPKLVNAFHSAFLERQEVPELEESHPDGMSPVIIGLLRRTTFISLDRSLLVINFAHPGSEPRPDPIFGQDVRRVILSMDEVPARILDGISRACNSHPLFCEGFLQDKLLFYIQNKGVYPF